MDSPIKINFDDFYKFAISAGVLGAVIFVVIASYLIVEREQPAFPPALKGVFIIFAIVYYSYAVVSVIVVVWAGFKWKKNQELLDKQLAAELQKVNMEILDKGYLAKKFDAFLKLNSLMTDAFYTCNYYLTCLPQTLAQEKELQDKINVFIDKLNEYLFFVSEHETEEKLNKVRSAFNDVKNAILVSKNTTTFDWTAFSVSLESARKAMSEELGINKIHEYVKSTFEINKKIKDKKK